MGETGMDKLAALRKFVEHTDLAAWKRQRAADSASAAARERRSGAARKASTPEVCARRAAAGRQRFSDPTERARARARTAAMWADPIRRAERVAQIQAHWRGRRAELDAARAPAPLPLPGAPPPTLRADDSARDNRPVGVDGALLRRLREGLGLTLREAAARARMTAGNLSYIENGGRQPAPASFARLCHVYGVAVGRATGPGV